MTELHVNKKIFTYLVNRHKAGKFVSAVYGGRRSGKTYTISQFLLMQMYNDGDVVNVASMTQEQGRLGAYEDFKKNIDALEWSVYFEVLTSPREIRMLHNKGKAFFNSYKQSETAKGIACDWLYLNEANNFTKQQYTDLVANVRKGVIMDFNPAKFWVNDYIKPDEQLHTTWMDNAKHLTSAQLDYFAKLKELGDRPDANPVDRRNYLAYYLGQFSELSGKIFHSGNTRFVVDELDKWVGLKKILINCDPSAMRGADYFAMVLSGEDSMGNYVVMDTDSVNIGTREEQAKKLRTWCATYDVESIHIETNGIIGQEFYEYCINSGLPVQPLYSRGNKFERIVSRYEDLTSKVVIMDTPRNREYMEQVYMFDEKCEHDDNVDALERMVFLRKILT
jgi:hypothetical protein